MMLSFWCLVNVFTVFSLTGGPSRMARDRPQACGRLIPRLDGVPANKSHVAISWSGNLCRGDIDACILHGHEANRDEALRHPPGRCRLRGDGIEEEWPEEEADLSVVPEVARARGIPLRLTNLLVLVVVAAVEQAALMVGALLSPPSSWVRSPSRYASRHGRGPARPGGPCGDGGDESRDPPRLRHLLLAAGRAGVAGQFLHHPHPLGLPGRHADGAGRSPCAPGHRGSRIVSTLFGALFPPGLVSAAFMLHARIAGTAMAIMSGLVGAFVNLRGGTFAAHATPRAAFTGAAAVFRLGVCSVLGMAVCAMGMALLLGTFEWRDRTGIGSPGVLTALLLAAILGIGDLLLTVGNAYGPAVFALLVGQLVGISAAQTIRIGILAVVLALVLTVPVVGALRSFALLVGSAAATRRLSDRLLRTAGWAMRIGVVTVWLSIWVAYDTGLPNGFVVTTVAAVF